MHKARAFFFVCAGLFLLALAYHLGARSAGAQEPSNPVVGVSYYSGYVAVATSNGDVYLGGSSGWTQLPNVFGAPTAAQRTTVGQLKARYSR